MWERGGGWRAEGEHDMGAAVCVCTSVPALRRLSDFLSILLWLVQDKFTSGWTSGELDFTFPKGL
ncbi:MAG: hypothetical protein ACKESB_02640 [Candidatus Hodgkinia cicadicola]